MTTTTPAVRSDPGGDRGWRVHRGAATAPRAARRPARGTERRVATRRPRRTAPRAATSTTPADGTQDFDGAEVTITGSERDDPSVIAINGALAAFGEANNIDIQFTGDADWESNINTQVEAGNPPNIALFPQPGKLADFVDDGYVVQVSPEVQANVEENFDPKFSDYAVVDDALYGVPVKVDLKSLVWYKPAVFEENGWEVPETFDDFTALIEHDEDRRRRPQAAVRRHRVRHRHRLAVHRLDRGDGAAHRRPRRLRPVGQPRDPVRRPAGRRRDGADHRAVVGGERVRRRRHDRLDELRHAQRPGARPTTSATCTARPTSSAACSRPARCSPTSPTRTRSTSSTSRTSTARTRC